MTVRVEASGEDLLVWIKVVPGASRDEIGGVLGERLKVRVSAPPEGGKANKAVCGLLATTFGVRPRDVSVESGAGNPEKVVRVRGCEVQCLVAALSRVLAE